MNYNETHMIESRLEGFEELFETEGFFVEFDGPESDSEHYEDDFRIEIHHYDHGKIGSFLSHLAAQDFVDSLIASTLATASVSLHADNVIDFEEGRLKPGRSYNIERALKNWRRFSRLEVYATDWKLGPRNSPRLGDTPPDI